MPHIIQITYTPPWDCKNKECICEKKAINCVLKKHRIPIARTILVLFKEYQQRDLGIGFSLINWKKRITPCFVLFRNVYIKDKRKPKLCRETTICFLWNNRTMGKRMFSKNGTTMPTIWNFSRDSWEQKLLYFIRNQNIYKHFLKISIQIDQQNDFFLNNFLTDYWYFILGRVSCGDEFRFLGNNFLSNGFCLNHHFW